MAYGQKNYNQIQGINGKYTIRQIGCLLTSFANLTRRFKEGELSPPQLNTLFKARNAYIDVDDGIRDDLGWHSITAVRPKIVVDKIGSSKVPPHRNSIVRIRANNQFGTHFCLVWDIKGKLKKTVYIRDSWDGQIKKSSFYGPITGWATYKDLTPLKVKTKVKK